MKSVTTATETVPKVVTPEPVTAKRPPRWRETPIVDPTGRWFQSQISAAKVHGKWPSDIGLLCRLGRHGWRFAEPGEGPDSDETPGDGQ
jgi:hypothetical protein